MIEHDDPGGVDKKDAGGGDNATVSPRESFVTIFTHPLIWFYAAAYAW